MSARAAKSAGAEPRRRGAAQRDGVLPHEALFREVNERMVSLQAEPPDGALAIVCECRNVDCNAEIQLAAAEYEAVRRFPTRFLVKRGHERAEDDRLVHEADDYVVVEKSGAAGIGALRTDPRRRRRAAAPHAPLMDGS